MLGQITTGDVPNYAVANVNDKPNARGFFFPIGVAIDLIRHRLYVGDTVDHRVVEFDLDANNRLIDRVADHVLGQTTMNANAASVSTMNQPIGLAVDTANDRLFVTDELNNRVLVYNVATLSDGMSPSFVFGQSNFSTNASSTSQSGLFDPSDVKYDASSNKLYVADYDNNRIVIYDLSQGISNGMNASSVLGQLNFATNTATTTQTGMFHPHAIFVDSANSRLFVSDIFNNRVLVFNIASISNGMAAANVLGQTTFTASSTAATQNGMNGPVGIILDASNRLFVTDHYNNRVLVYDISQGISNGMNAMNVIGQPNFTASSTATTQNGMNGPEILAYDPGNNLLYVPQNQIHRISIFNVATTTNGQAAVDLLGELDKDDTPAYTKSGPQDSPNATGFNFNLGVALDKTNHRLFAGDLGNNRVLVFNLNSDNMPTDREADFVLGQPNISTATASTTAHGMNQPIGLAVNNAGTRLYVADFGNNRVLVFDVTPGVLTDGKDASNVIGQQNFTSAVATTTQTGLKNPQGVVFDEAHSRLFVSDNTNNRILIYDTSSGISNGMAAAHVLGQNTFSTATASTTASSLITPYNPVYDSTNDRLIVSDFGNNRVLVYNTATITDGQTAVSVLGQSSFTASSTATTQTGMNGPDGAAFDSDGNLLFVSDYANNRVLVYDISTISNGQAAVAVIGQNDFTSSANAASQSGLKNPTELAYDSTNKLLYVVDSQHHRIMAFKFIKLSAGLQDGYTGTNYLQSLGVSAAQGTVSYSLLSGTLPSGFSLSSSGVLSGVVTASGAYSFSVRGSDALGASGAIPSTAQSYSLTLRVPTMVSVPSGYGAPYGPSASVPGATSSERTAFSSAPVRGGERVSDLKSQLKALLQQMLRLKGTLPPSIVSFLSKSSSFSRNLGTGMQGSDVKGLQTFLIQQNAGPRSKDLAAWGANGVFGPLTKAALIEFQAHAGISASGFFGPLTRMWVQVALF
jgi:DNA-binding beta-propeller fold protein YncE